MEPIRTRAYPLLAALAALLVYLGVITQQDAVAYLAFSGVAITVIFGPVVVETARANVTPVEPLIVHADANEAVVAAWRVKSNATVEGTP